MASSSPTKARREDQEEQDAGAALRDPCEMPPSAPGDDSLNWNSQSALLEVNQEEEKVSQSETDIQVHNAGWVEEEELEKGVALKKKDVWQPHWFVELLLFLVLGASGWWSSNIIGAEQPIFVLKAPESDKLSNLISVSLQIGNIFPIAYKVILSCRTGKSSDSLLPYTIFSILLVGCVSLFVCAFFWSSTFNLFHHEHSVILLVCSFLSGGVGALSNVTYWALTSHFETRCIKALSTGMTFGGLVATGLALAQNAGAHPRFSVMVFMLIAGAVQVLVIGAFIPIMRLRRHHVDAKIPPIHAEKKKKYSIQKGASRSLVVEGSSDDTAPLLPKKRVKQDIDRPSVAINGDEDDSAHQIAGPARYGSVNDSGIDESPPTTPPTGSPFAEGHSGPSLLKRIFSRNNTLIYISFLLYGMTYTIPSLMPFLADGYKAEHLDSSIYLWMLVLQNVGDVGGRLATAFPWHPKLRHLVALFCICVLLFAAFILATVFRNNLSDVLPKKSGFVLSVSCLIYYFCRGYLITSLYVYAKTNFAPKEAESLSTNLGFLGQIGALLANIIMFIVVNVCGLLGS